MSEQNSHPEDGGPKRIIWEVSEERLTQIAAGIAAEILETQFSSFSRGPTVYAAMIEIIVRHLQG